MKILEEEIKEGTEEIFEAMMIENLPKVMLRHQITDLGDSNNIKQDKYKKRDKPLLLGISYLNFNKPKMIKFVREDRGTKIIIIFNFAETTYARREQSEIKY